MLKILYSLSSCLILVLFLTSLVPLKGASPQLEYVPNEGQWVENVLYQAHVGDGFVYLE